MMMYAKCKAYIHSISHSIVINFQYHLVGGVNPSEKYESQLGWWHSQYMESHKIHVPNHQPSHILRRNVNLAGFHVESEWHSSLPASSFLFPTWRPRTGMAKNNISGLRMIWTWCYAWFLTCKWSWKSNWWFQPPWKIWKSDWIIIPTIGESRTCSKPPTRSLMV